MKDLLNKGFQPVSETEMVMVDGGDSWGINLSASKRNGLIGWINDAMDTNEKEGFNFKFPAKFSYRIGNISAFISADVGSGGKSPILKTPVGNLKSISIGFKLTY